MIGPWKPLGRRIALAIAAAITFACAAPAEDASERTVIVEEDGTVHQPALTVPMSDYLTPEGKAYVTEHLKVLQTPGMTEQVDGVPRMLAGYIERMHAVFPTVREDTRIAGVHAYVYTPAGGIAQEHERRVLINLHGGGFIGCWPGCAELESMPLASLGKVRVVSVDYRQGPQFRHPAASEDLAAVYRELLKAYPAGNIGIYGCSAGGMLAGMSVAWFQQHGLPRPGAIGVLCAGLAMPNGFPGGGDSMHALLPIGEARVSMAPSPGPTPARRPEGYFDGSDPADPLISPALSLDVLAQFPPTLVVSGTRGMELSGAAFTHSQLVKAGADAQLNVWEGMFHGFFYNPDVPESRDCYDVIVKFFDRHLGR